MRNHATRKTNTPPAKQINELTVVCQRVAIPEVDEGGEGLDAVSLGQLGVLELDHLDPVVVTLVVNVLKLIQNLIASSAILLDCNLIKIVNLIRFSLNLYSLQK